MTEATVSNPALIQTLPKSSIEVRKCALIQTYPQRRVHHLRVMLQYLHAIGFDVLLFVPTGYGLVTEDLLRSGLQKIDLSNYNFSIQYSEIVSNRKGLLNRLFHRLAK